MSLTINISEIFYSIQGEGIHLGVPSVFVRTSTCNLRCSWCDTPYTSWNAEINKRTIDEILQEIEECTSNSKGSHPLPVIITGGEPYLQKNLPLLVTKLKELGHFVSVETNATIFLPTGIDFYSLSPKLANSTPQDDAKWITLHEDKRLNLQSLSQFILDCQSSPKDYQLKFVLNNSLDFQEVFQLRDTLSKEYNIHLPEEKIIIMPQGRSQEEIQKRYQDLVNICLKHNFRLSPRLHVDIWGDKRGV